MRNNYVFELDRKVVALIMNDIGFHSASTIALDGLSRVFSERMRVLCKAVALFAGHAGRTKPVLEDVGLAFSWMGISLREIVDYCAQTKPTSVLLRIPRFPVRRPRKLKFGNDSVDSDGRLACIPESLPEPSLETEVSKVNAESVETADKELRMSLTGKGTNYSSQDIIDWESMDSVSLGLVDQATLDILNAIEEEEEQDYEEEEEQEQDYEEEEEEEYEYEYEEELDEEKETDDNYGREKRKEIFEKKNYQANVKSQPVVSKSKSSKSKKKNSKKQDRSFMLPASSANIEASIETIISSALSEVSGNSETKLDIPTAETTTPEGDKEQQESEEMDTAEDTTSGSQSSQTFAIVGDQADDRPGRPVVLTLRSISEKRKAKDMTKPDVEPVKKKKKKKKKKHHDDSEAMVTSINEAVPSSSTAEEGGAVKLRIKISNLSLDFDVKEAKKKKEKKKKKKKKRKKEKERKNKHAKFVQSVVEEEEKQAHAEMKVPKLIIKWQNEEGAVVSVKQEEKSSQAEVEVDSAGATLASDLSHCSNLPTSAEQVHLSNVGRFPEQSTETENNETADDDWYCPYCFLGERKGVAMVGCDGCDNWFHYDCAGVITEPPSNEPWYCNGCSNVRSRAATTSGAVPALSLALKKVTNGNLKKKKKKRT
ncbi:Transcription initiation factor TFIID subunit 3 [Trichinella pseudospiralis]|uniref:Transcription initiation factor TFIID subunit 3 n=1 Tax=Trichinella pseudospiralis TaxID=6337 RepID=A0A0V1G5P9_TRIPS|nr:Transcription initiation factor TFIID subunit 3 [Trichinella pseudospiralis]